MKEKDAYYFPHDYNAKYDPKIVRLLIAYGWEGYGLFWAIVELLRGESNYRLKIDEFFYNILSYQLKCGEDFIKKYIEDCVNNFRLFKIENGYFFSESLIRRMEWFEKRKRDATNAANKRWENQRKNNRNSSEGIGSAMERIIRP